MLNNQSTVIIEMSKRKQRTSMMTDNPNQHDPPEGDKIDQLTDGWILDNWLTTSQVAEMHNMTTKSVVDAIKAGRIIGRSMKLFNQTRWFAEPESAKNFKKGNTGPKQTDE